MAISGENWYFARSTLIISFLFFTVMFVYAISKGLFFYLQPISIVSTRAKKNNFGEILCQMSYGIWHLGRCLGEFHVQNCGVLSLLKLQTKMYTKFVGKNQPYKVWFSFSGNVLVCGFFVVLQDVSQLFDKIRHYVIIT